MCKIKEEVKSILVIRSAPLMRTFDALKKLREQYPNAKISILVQPEVKDKIEKAHLVDRIITGIKKGKVSIFRYFPLLLQLKREMYDLVVIIYNTDNISWYTNLWLFASAVRAKEKVGITIYNTLQPFGKREIFLGMGSNFLKPLQLIFTIPLSILIVLYLVILILFYDTIRSLQKFRKVAPFTTKFKKRYQK